VEIKCACSGGVFVKECGCEVGNMCVKCQVKMSDLQCERAYDIVIFFLV
jgi:hypothetical protein